MIVTSLRCFLNILTQMCSMETLLNANYFIGDVKNPNDFMLVGDSSLYYDEYGTIKTQEKEEIAKCLFNRYNITYDNTLNPTPYLTSLLNNDDLGLEDKFMNQLMLMDTTINVYNFLFKDRLKGNGLQILIFYDENTVTNFCHIICQYLSNTFGCDINFIDAMYRPDVKGNKYYAGCDKDTALRNINHIRDEKLVMDFKSFCSYGVSNTLSNLTVFLNGFDAPSLIYLYNLIFPNEPLPPDNYTVERLKTIIIGKATENSPYSGYSNLIIDDSSQFLDYIDQYDDDCY